MKILFIISALFLSCIYANTLKEIKEQGMLRVGVMASNYPLSDYKNGEFIGFEIELAKEIAHGILGTQYRVEFINLTVGQRTEALKNNEVDIVIANFTITERRKNEIEFSIPYFFVNTAVLTKRSSDIRVLKDLTGKKLALISNGQSAENLGNFNYTPVKCEFIDDCFTAFKSEQALALVGDDIVLYKYLADDESLEIPIKRVGRVDFIAVGVDKNSPKLLQEVDKILLELHKNGKIQKIYDEVIGPIYGRHVDSDEFLFVDIYSEL